ncbi:MAG: hypothetical protein ACJ76I_11220 [Gaiellaceae bacterium]
MSSESDFAPLAAAAFNAKLAPRLLAETQRAVVLERIARGAGATRWYLLGAPDDLDAFTLVVRPGSRVSFYFDNRFLIGAFDDQARQSVAEIIERDGEAVIGAVRAAEIEAEVDFPNSATEADEFARCHRRATIVVGAFPAADDDQMNAVTVALPDADSIVHPHPH